MRNNDWTDALRERLSSSELAPASDIWSKVESAASEVTGSHRADPKPFWWAAGCIAAAALAAIIILPDAGRTGSLQVDPHPQTVMAQSLSSQDTQVPGALSTSGTAVVPPSVQRPSAGPASVSCRCRSSSVPPTESFGDTLSPEGAETPFTLSSESKSSMPASDISGSTDRQEISDRTSPTVSHRPVEGMLFEDIQDDAPKQRRHLSASLFASGIPGGPGADGKYQISTVTLGDAGIYTYGSLVSAFGPGTGPGTNAETEHLVIERLLKNVHHHRPVSIGLALSYPLNGRWFLESGLTYSYLRSEYDIPSELHISYEIDGKRFESSGLEGGQTLHFIGVPLKAGYRFTMPNRFSVSLSAGAMAERCVYGEWLGNKVTVDGTQFSAVASASVQYRMGDRLSFFVSPEWSYYFTETELPTYRTETPFAMTLRLGLNLDIGNISLPEK